MEVLIAKRYAKALIDAGGDIASSATTLNALSQAMQDNEIAQTIISPIISVQTKVDMLVASLGENADAKMVNLIKLLGEKRRLDLVPLIAKDLNATLQKESNHYEGVIKSPTVLNEDTVADLENTLNRYTGATVKLTQKESQTQGLIVSVEDLGIEINFSKQKIKEQLINFINKSL